MYKHGYRIVNAITAFIISAFIASAQDVINYAPLSISCLKDNSTSSQIISNNVTDFFNPEDGAASVSAVISAENCYRDYDLVLGNENVGGKLTFSLNNSASHQVCRVILYASQLYKGTNRVESSITINDSSPVEISTREGAYLYFPVLAELSEEDMQRITIESTAGVKVRYIIFIYTESDEASETEVETVKISNATLAGVAPGYSNKLSYSISPIWAANQNVTWSSSDENIITVNQDGIFTAVSAGQASIYVRSVSNPDAFGECKVTVKEIAPTKITVYPAKPTVGLGGSIQFYVDVEPENASKSVTWSTTSPSKVDISEDGIYTPKATGTIVVRATSTVDETIKGITSLTIKENLPVESVRIEQERLTLMVGEQERLSAEVLPIGASNRRLDWECDMPGILKISDEGVITALAAGAATVTARTTDGTDIKSQCQIEVKEDPTMTIPDLDTDGLNISIVDGLISFTGLEPGTFLALYDISGQRLHSVFAAGSTAMMKTPGKGVYILSIGVQSYKIVIK